MQTDNTISSVSVPFMHEVQSITTKFCQIIPTFTNATITTNPFGLNMF